MRQPVILVGQMGTKLLSQLTLDNKDLQYTQ